MHNQHRNKPAINRRKFIHRAGLALGVSALSPVLPLFDSAWNGLSNRIGLAGLKIGVLLPASHIYPTMADNFISGINLYFARYPKKGNIDLIYQKLGFGTHSMAEKAEKLVTEKRVDILTGIVSESVASNLDNLLAEHDIFLVANHTGANLVRRHEHSRFVIHNSLNLWQANYAMGVWAAKNMGKKAAVVSSFYESGYDAQYAFGAGFEAAQGEILYTGITNLPAEMDNPQNIITEINRYHPDLVFASFSGKEAVDFVRDYKSSALTNQIPLLGSGFLVEDSILPDHGKAAEGILSCHSWTNDSERSEYAHFASNFKDFTGKDPDSFAILGYESARIIDQAIKISEGNFRKTDLVEKVFTQGRFISPRGELKLNPETHVFDSPLYIRQVRKQKNIFVNLAGEKIAPLKTTDELYAGLKSGWLNPYLCV